METTDFPPARFYSACNRPDLIAGCDRGLFILLLMLCLGLAMAAQSPGVFLLAGVFMLAGIRVLRKLAANDPLLAAVYRRHIGYRAYYAPQATSWRENTEADRARWNGSKKEVL